MLQVSHGCLSFHFIGLSPSVSHSVLCLSQQVVVLVVCCKFCLFTNKGNDQDNHGDWSNGIMPVYWFSTQKKTNIYCGGQKNVLKGIF